MTEQMGAMSARNRLKKAASLGFGPLMEKKDGGPPDGRRALAPPREYRSRSRSRGRASSGAGSEPPSAAALAVREQQDRRREALRQVLKQASDEDDVDGFLSQAKKPKQISMPAGQKNIFSLDVKVSKLDLKISTSTAARATAAASGARPKAGAKAASAPKPKEPEEPPQLSQRQQEEKVRAEFEKMQREAKRTVDPLAAAALDEADAGNERYPGDEDYDSEEEDSKKRKREQKKQREEWRKQRKQELNHQSKKKRGSSESEAMSESDDEMTKLEKQEKEEAKSRANMWRTINNNGRYSKVAGQYVGQLSDRDLDKRIEDAKKKQGGEQLMSEAEAIAKLQKGRGGTTSGRNRSRSPKRT